MSIVEYEGFMFVLTEVCKDRGRWNIKDFVPVALGT